MRKLLLVVLIGMVLVLNMYGISKEIVSYIEAQQEQEVNDLEGIATIVYVEE